MADGLARVRQDIEAGRFAAEAVQADPDLLLNELRLRLTPGLRRLPQAPPPEPG